MEIFFNSFCGSLASAFLFQSNISKYCKAETFLFFLNKSLEIIRASVCYLSYGVVKVLWFYRKKIIITYVE